MVNRNLISYTSIFLTSLISLFLKNVKIIFLIIIQLFLLHSIIFPVHTERNYIREKICIDILYLIIFDYSLHTHIRYV